MFATCYIKVDTIVWVYLQPHLVLVLPNNHPKVSCIAQPSQCEVKLLFTKPTFKALSDQCKTRGVYFSITHPCVLETIPLAMKLDHMSACRCEQSHLGGEGVQHARQSWGCFSKPHPAPCPPHACPGCSQACVAFKKWDTLESSTFMDHCQ